jgi:predicted dehydrogenase
MALTCLAQIKVYSSIETLLSDESIDVVDIVLPIPATSRAIEQSLAAGHQHPPIFRHSLHQPAASACMQV